MASDEEQYGELLLTHAQVVVHRAPDRVLLSLEAFRQMRDDVFCGADRIYVGNTPDGIEVIYEITGWDGERNGLVIERVAGSVVGPVGLADRLVCRACVMGGCKAHPGDTCGYQEGRTTRG